MTFSATGIIIPVVAVLLNHIDKNHDGNMNPITILHIVIIVHVITTQYRPI